MLNNKRMSATAPSSKGRAASYVPPGITSMCSSKFSGGSGKGTSSYAQQTSSSIAAIASGSPRSPDSAVVIPLIKSNENARLLPKYTAALSRQKDEYLPAEDLDSVQLELEMLLSTVALRYRVLKSEYETIDKEDRRDKKSKLSERPPASPGKRKRMDEKKTKHSGGVQFKMTKLKNSSAHSPAASQHTDDSMDANPNYNHYQNTKPSMQKNDAPNKFWLSVEPYCMPLTNEDLKLLDDLLEEYNGPLVPPIPDLGPHYSQTWATEDLKEEQDNSNAKNVSKPRGNLSQNSDVVNILKKSKKIMGEGVTGPLTQRLVSALVEENLMPEGILNADSNSSSENTTNSTSTLRSLALMKNGISIEKRVKKELIEQGILDPEDFQKEQDDEVLAEIKRVLTEVSAIAEYNSGELRKLENAAKLELRRLEVKRKLDSVDQEIIEIYKKVMLAKKNRRPLTEQEREEIFRLTLEQKRLSDQLEAMPMPGQNVDD